MNILTFHDQLMLNYKSYIQSFLNIKDSSISEFVDNKIRDKELWPEPLVQFNPTFEKGADFEKLVNEQVLHPKMKEVFPETHLYRHQEEAIRLGAAGKEFIVTSGTGSGKSLTYLATIFNHVLNAGTLSTGKTVAVIVYPMNALINSQTKAIEDFKNAYEQNGAMFPVTFGQYTGQESDVEKEAIQVNPPHILLTNYMMLELIMTRGGKDVDIRKNVMANLRYLVFDELHTYRGRQGSDVAILIRRIKAGASQPVHCIGTSATMVSSETDSILEQKSQVAKIGSLIFGTDLQADQIVNEYLVRSIGDQAPVSEKAVNTALQKPVNLAGSFLDFERHPIANWLEENIALEKKEGILIRRKPATVKEIAEALAVYSATDKNSSTAECFFEF